MNKIVIKLVAILVSFFALWLLLSQFNWMDIFNVNETTSKTEEKIGELYVEAIQQNETTITVDSLHKPIQDIIDLILEENDLELDVKLHVIDKDMINAFAIPDNNMILFTGLIKECESPEELAGVLGHEIAHMQKNHVMKKLIKEIGLSVLISMASGGNSNMIQETLKSLTSSAYDRSLESEADITSVSYLQNAKIDPKPFADFLFRLSLEENQSMQSLQLMSSHPASEERAKTILDNQDLDKEETQPLMTEEKWKTLQMSFKEFTDASFDD